MQLLKSMTDNVALSVIVPLKQSCIILPFLTSFSCPVSILPVLSCPCDEFLNEHVWLNFTFHFSVLFLYFTNILSSGCVKNVLMCWSFCVLYDFDIIFLLSFPYSLFTVVVWVCMWEHDSKTFHLHIITQQMTLLKIYNREFFTRSKFSKKAKRSLCFCFLLFLASPISFLLLCIKGCRVTAGIS